MNQGMILVVGITALYTSGMVIISRNAVSSVIYLVGTIINGGLIFMMLGINIIPLIYIIVYVGGIAILFLFVIMMVELHQENKKTKGVGFMSGIGVVLPTVMVYINEGMERGWEEGLGIITGYRSMRWENSTMTLEMIKSIGYIIYSENIMALIIIGFVLLMVMMSLNLLLKVKT